MPAIYHEGSWLGNATDPEVLVKDTVGWTGKNLLKNTATTQTVNGITFTVNADGSVTINGTATGNANFILYRVGASFPIGNFILSNGGIFNFQCYLNCKSGDTIAHNYQTQGKLEQEVIIDYADYDNLVFGLWVPSGTTVSNVTVYPMLRKADITDPAYEPYHESVEEVVEQVYADNGVLGAKNLLENTGVAQTINGVTFTVNADKSVTVNGTATANAIFYISEPNKNIVFDSPVIFSGSPSQSANDTVYMRVDRYNGNTYVDGIICYGGNEVLLSDITKKYRDFRITVLNGKTVSNLTFYPMLRLASDPDDTYVPYAMTNRELTEKVFEKRTLTSSDDLDNILETGIYEVTTAPANSPEGHTYYTLLVRAKSANHVQQIAFIPKTNDGYMYMRVKGGSSVSWMSWLKFTGTVVS